MSTSGPTKTWGAGPGARGLVLALVLALGAGGQTSAPAGASPGPRALHHATLVLEFPGDPAGEVQPPSPAVRRGVILRARNGGTAQLTSSVLDAPFPFENLLPSWNVALPPESRGKGRREGGFSVFVRLQDENDVWSPWLDFGGWGKRPKLAGAVTRWDGGRVAVDEFKGTREFLRAQYRILVQGAGKFLVHRFALCFTGRGTDEAETASPSSGQKEPPRRLWARRLPVPFITQKTEDPKIAHRNCSPTSVAMVMAYRGVRRDKDDVARRLFDPEHDIFGNWNRAVQGAFTYGVPGYLTRFSRWKQIKESIARGQPLVISIKAKKGELTGAPYTWTAGHLLVLCGFDGKGGALVNDPAARDARRGRLTYSMAELERAWLDKGGTAYVLLPRK